MREYPDETSVNGCAKDTITNKPYAQINRHPAWFNLRVFYVRISNVQVNDSTPESLTLNHIPLSPETRLEVNGRTSTCSNVVSSFLRRDRVDKKSEEATFVCTDSIRTTGEVKFEVFDKENLILTGFLEISNNNGSTTESEGSMKLWAMNCQSEITACAGFLKGKHVSGPDPPIMEVYVAGSFLDTPIILTKTLILSYQSERTASPRNNLQVAEYRNCKPYTEDDYGSMYWRRTEYMDSEGGELSWFNAGIRVGVGIGLGMFVGVGIGIGLLVRTYQSTARNFKRRLL